MDVSRGIQKEESRASKRVVGISRDFKNSNVIVSGLEFRNDFDVFDRDAIVLGLVLGLIRVVGLLRFGYYWIALERFWSDFKREFQVYCTGLAGNLNWIRDKRSDLE